MANVKRSYGICSPTTPLWHAIASADGWSQVPDRAPCVACGADTVYLAFGDRRHPSCGPPFPELPFGADEAWTLAVAQALENRAEREGWRRVGPGHLIGAAVIEDGRCVVCGDVATWLDAGGRRRHPWCREGLTESGEPSELF